MDLFFNRKGNKGTAKGRKAGVGTLPRFIHSSFFIFPLSCFSRSWNFFYRKGLRGNAKGRKAGVGDSDGLFGEHLFTPADIADLR
jgi:hypothetical protein